MKIEVLLAVLMCSVVVFGVVLDNREKLFKKVISRARRFTEDGRNSFVKPNLNFTDKIPPLRILSRVSASIVLECHAGGSPPPTIHWLKNGIRFKQSSSENDDNSIEKQRNGNAPLLGISVTKSKLFLDCILPQDAGKYTCVAETPSSRISTTSNVIITDVGNYSPECTNDKRNYGKSGRIVMWTGNRLELEGADIQLFCRATGYPTPQITWYDTNSELIKGNDKYQILPNGDLLLKQLNFEEDMGGFICKASNEFGSDEEVMFVYPTTMD